MKSSNIQTRVLLAILLLAVLLMLTACTETAAPATTTPATGGETTGQTGDAGADAPVWPAPGMTFNLAVGFAPGGTNDAMTRITAPYLERYLGIPVVVQNIPGAGGLVGHNSVFASPSDGLTAIYTATTDGIFSFYHLSPTALPWSVDDWRGTGIWASMMPMGFVSLHTSPWNDFADLIEDARNRPPRDITIATMGPGRIEDLWMIEIQEFFGVEFNWVFYEGSAAIQTDLMTGDLDVGIIGVAREDFLDHPEFRVLTGITAAYPEESIFHGALPVLSDFEDRLNFSMSDLVALDMTPILSWVVKADTPEYRFEILVEAMRRVAANPDWQEEIRAFTWPTFIAPGEGQEEIFAEISADFASFVELHRQYVN